MTYLVGQLPTVGGVGHVTEAGNEAEVSPDDLRAVLIDLLAGESGLVLVVSLEESLVLHDLDDEAEELRPPEAEHGDLVDHVVLGENIRQLDSVKDNEVIEEQEDTIEEVSEVLSNLLLRGPRGSANLVEDFDPVTELRNLTSSVDGARGESEILGKNRLAINLLELNGSELGGVLKGLVEVRTSVLIVAALDDVRDTIEEGIIAGHFELLQMI